MMLVPLSAMRGKISAGDVVKNLTLVLLGNLLGALFVAFFLAVQTKVIGDAGSDGSALLTYERLASIAEGKTGHTAWETFLRGVGCNWLVCLAVWMSLAAQSVSGKILAIFFPVMAFVAMGFDHVVANMFFIPAAIWAGVPGVGWGDAIGTGCWPGRATWSAPSSSWRRPTGTCSSRTSRTRRRSPRNPPSAPDHRRARPRLPAESQSRAGGGTGCCSIVPISWTTSGFRTRTIDVPGQPEHQKPEEDPREEVVRVGRHRIHVLVEDVEQRRHDDDRQDCRQRVALAALAQEERQRDRHEHVAEHVAERADRAGVADDAPATRPRWRP